MGSRCTIIYSIGICSLVLSVGSACTGNMPSTAAGVSSLAAAGEPTSITTLGATPLLRLTSDQYDNLVRDLLGDSTQPASSALSDESAGPFPSNSVASVSGSTLSIYENLADDVTTRMLPNIIKQLPCDPNAPGVESTCVQQYVTNLAPLVYRRGVAASEIADLLALFTAERASATFIESVRIVTSALLQSPFFLYHVEQGGAVLPGTHLAPLSQYERASRLAFFLWNSGPDAALLAAADANELQTAAQMETQARRMLTSPKAVATVQDFYTYWLAVNDLADQVKDPNAFPLYSTALFTSMLDETGSFIADWFAQSNPDVKLLLTAPYTFVDANLAKLYGTPLPNPQSTGMQRVTLPSTRAGLLMQGAFLASNAHADSTSIVLRGLFVRTNLLCQVIASPPADVNTSVPPANPNQTSRQVEDAHRANPACSSCHSMLDPVGYGFEEFDGIGQYRTMDGTQPVDPSGQIIATDVDGTYINSIDEVNRLAQSKDVQNCMATQWFRFATGRVETSDDAPLLQNIQATFAANTYNIRELMVAIGRSDAMLFIER